MRISIAKSQREGFEMVKQKKRLSGGFECRGLKSAVENDSQIACMRGTGGVVLARGLKSLLAFPIEFKNEKETAS